MTPGIFSIAQPPEKVVYTRSNATNSDIRRLIPQMAKISAGQTARIAEQFRGISERESAKKIWTFLKNNVTYLEDTDLQQVKAPSALLRDGNGDCKSFSVFTSGILTNLKIPHSFLYASYNGDPTPTHVYVETDSGLIIDGVYNKFNGEKKYIYKYKQKMNLQGITGIGAVEKSSVKHAANKVLMAPIRGLFILVLKTNILGLASVLNLKAARSWTNNNTKNSFLDHVGRVAYNFGWDNSKSIQQAWLTGSIKKATGIKLLTKLKKENRGKYIKALLDAAAYYKSKGYDITTRGTNGIGALTEAQIAALISVLPIVIAILQPFFDSESNLSEYQQAQIAGQLDDELGLPSGTTDKYLNAPDPPPTGDRQDGIIPGFSNTYLLIGGIIVLAGVALYVSSKRSSK